MKRLIHLLKRIGLLLLVVMVILTATGFVYQTISTLNDRRTIPLPGELVEVDGYSLHISVMGEADGRPTVILENGGGGILPQWGWLQPEIALYTKVVAYDRPGTGWSEKLAEPIDAETSARILRKALEALEIDGPFVVVGHSMGGLMGRVFAKVYPEEVAGLVLVDPRDVTWEGVYSQEEARVPTEIYRFLEFLARFGVVRALGFAENQVKGLPQESFEQAVALGSTPKYFNGILQDALNGDTAVDYLLEGEEIQDTPVIVLSSGSPDEAFDADQRESLVNIHARLAAKSSLGEHRIIPGAGHLSIVMEPDYAKKVAGIVREMVTQLEEQQER